MSLLGLLLVLLVIGAVVGGWGHRAGWGYTQSWSPLGVVLVVLIALWVLGYIGDGHAHVHRLRL